MAYAQRIYKWLIKRILDTRSYLVLAIFAILASSITYLLYKYTEEILKDRLQERLVATVATAAVQFDPELIKKINGPESIDSPELKNLVDQLEEIRNANQNIKYAYLMQRSADPQFFEFIADADMLQPLTVLDENQNGVLDENEAPPMPGDPYPIDEYPVLRDEAFFHPSVDRTLQPDQWGLLMASYAPIYDETGEAIAIIGLDVIVNDFYAKTRETLLPFLLFISFLVLLLTLLTFLLVRFWRERVNAIKELDRQKDAVLHMVAHQFKGPVTTINFITELLLDETFGQLTSDQKENITTIRNASKKMGSQSEMVLDAAKITLGKLPLEPGPLDLNELLKDIIAEAENHAKEKNVHLNISLPTTKLPIIILDRKYTQLALDNLLNNAVKYTAIKSAGGSVDFSVEEKGNVLYVSVRDTGIGIPKKDQENVFKELFRASNAGKDGNGLGLHVTKGAIEAQGGKLWFESEEGKGTTFHVELPLRKAESSK